MPYGFAPSPGSGVLSFPASGQLGSIQENVTTDNVNSVATGVTSKGNVVHGAVAVVATAVIVLVVGRGYLRNAKL